MTTTASSPSSSASSSSSASPSSHATFLHQKTFGSLDGLRALSILGVLWHHTFEIETPWRATQRGFLGVDLFFVISGFLIVTLLLRERDRPVRAEGGVGGISLKNFYIRRFLRIFPVYYGVLFALTAVFLTVGRNANMAADFFHDLPWALTYTSNWTGLATFLAITWSLSAEEQFYVVWPPVERYLAKAAVPVLLGLIAFSQLVHFGVFDSFCADHFGWSAAEPQMLKQTGFTPILLGVLLAHGLHDPIWHERLARLLRLPGLPFIASAAIVALCTFAPVDLTGWPRLSLHLVMVVLLGSCVIREDHGAAAVLRLPPLVRIGMLSYGIYLMHMLCRHACKVILDKLGVSTEPWLLISTLLVTVLVAQLSYTFYESRFLRLKDRFTGGPAHPPKPAATKA